MTTNKQQSTEEVEDWDAKLKLELTADNLKEWMTESYTKQKAALNEIREKMIDDGVPPDVAARNVSYEETPEQYVNKQRFKLWSSKKNNKLNDIPTMQALGLISDAEIEGVRAEHSGQLPPYYIIGGLNRIIDDRVKPTKDWITYNWIFEGLRVGNFEGQVNGEANYRINASGTRGYHVSLRTTTNVVQDKDGKDMRVTTFNQQATQLSDNINSRIYEIPFSKEVVAALLKHTRDGQVSLSITQISTGKHYGIKSLDEFLTEDPLALLHSLSTPRPAIDSKLLLDELEQRAVQKAQRDLEHHEQYG